MKRTTMRKRNQNEENEQIEKTFLIDAQVVCKVEDLGGKYTWKPGRVVWRIEDERGNLFLRILFDDCLLDYSYARIDPEDPANSQVRLASLHVEVE